MQPNIGTGLGWMAWTWQTALFFGVIALLLVLMTVLEVRRPGGDERRGVLGLVTTRGDRLFISLLAAGYVHLLWLAIFGAPLWGASAVALVLALLVFRYV
jgi:predicted small integral membrane protein